MDSYYKEKIAEEFLNCIRNTINRIKARSSSKEENDNPFQKALLPKEAIFWSRFERSFSTSFGQRAIETISKYVALATGAEKASTQKSLSYYLSDEEARNISTHIQALRNNLLGRSPNWEKDLLSVQVQKPSRTVMVISRFDLWFLRDGIDHYFSIKTVKPNIDQTAVAKEDILKIKTAFPECKAFLSLYYNPYGEKRILYNHSPSFKIFDMHNDNSVLIGKDYWDTIGCPGTYEEILEIAESVSEEATKIMKDFTC